MMELILNRIFQCQRTATVLVICLWKPKARWFTKMLALATQLPVRLPLSWDTVVDMAESGCNPVTPTGDKIKFAAWKLSGKAGPALEDCPLGLSQQFSLAGRRRLRSAMDWASGCTRNIAGNITWTSLPRVL